MSLPFLKDKEGGAAATSEAVRRSPDDKGDMGLLDACAQDILTAIERKDVGMLKGALEALVEHIQDLDYEQDVAQEG